LNNHPYLPKDMPIRDRLKHFRGALLDRIDYHQKCENHTTRICIDYLLEIYENIFESALEEQDNELQ
jgi:hypothetical protein